MGDAAEVLRGRVDELESQLAFQDELLTALNAIVAKQDADIVQLKQQLGLLASRLQVLAETVPGEPGDETPPHY